MNKHPTLTISTAITKLISTNCVIYKTIEYIIKLNGERREEERRQEEKLISGTRVSYQNEYNKIDWREQCAQTECIASGGVSRCG